jgi:hypothetical protein
MFSVLWKHFSQCCSAASIFSEQFSSYGFIYVTCTARIQNGSWLMWVLIGVVFFFFFLILMVITDFFIFQNVNFKSSVFLSLFHVGPVRANIASPYCQNLLLLVVEIYVAKCLFFPPPYWTGQNEYHFYLTSQFMFQSRPHRLVRWFLATPSVSFLGSDDAFQLCLQSNKNTLGVS